MWFSIALVALLGLYIAVWCVDRWIVTPRRSKDTLVNHGKRLDAVEKALADLNPKTEE